MYHQILLTQITVTVLLATEDDRRSINRNLSSFKLEVEVHILHKIINFSSFYLNLFPSVSLFLEPQGIRKGDTSSHIHCRGMRAREGHGNGLSCVMAYTPHTSSVNFNACKWKDWEKGMVLRVEVQSTVTSRESTRGGRTGMGRVRTGQELASRTRQICRVCLKMSFWVDWINVAFFLAYLVQGSHISIFWYVST